MTTDNVAEMMPEQLRDELTATKRVAQLWFRKTIERKRELAQARAELAAVDESLGEFYCPVLNPETEEACGSFWKDHGVHLMKKSLDHAEAALILSVRAQTQNEHNEIEIKLIQAHEELQGLRGANRALGQQLAGVKKNRDYWYDKTVDAEAKYDKMRKRAQASEADLKLNAKMLADQCDQARQAENERDEWRRKAQEQSNKVQANWLSPVETEGLKRQLAKTEVKLTKEIDHSNRLSCALRHYSKTTTQLTERLATLDAAEAALADCGIGGIYAEFDGLADAIQQMAQHIKELSSRLTQARAELADARLAAHTHELSIDLERQAMHIHSKAADELAQTINTERALRQEAERRDDLSRRELTAVHLVLSECGVQRNYYNDRPASAITRIYWLNGQCDEQRDERLEEQDYNALMRKYSALELRAEQYAESLGEERDAVHEALDECQILRNYDDGKPVSARTRIFQLSQRAENAEAQLSNGHGALTAAGIPQSDASGKLSICGRVMRLRTQARQRAERAEALAQLVNEETAELLERLASNAAGLAHEYSGLQDSEGAEQGEQIARALAARIREALEVNDED